MTNLDPIEISLVGSPRNRRQFLAVRGDTAAEPTVATEPVEEAVPVEASEATEPMAEEQPVVEASEVDPISAIIQNSVIAVSRGVVPTEVAEAVRLIASAAGHDIELSDRGELDSEAQIHVRSLLGALPEEQEIPESVVSAIQTVQDWVARGFPLAEAGLMSPMEASPMDYPQVEAPARERRRVVRADRLVSLAEDAASQYLAEGSMQVAKSLLQFCQSIKKALPAGGLIVVSGIVPNDGDMPIAQLSSLVKASDPVHVAAIQSIVDQACGEEWRSGAKLALEEFGVNVLAAMALSTPFIDKIQTIQAELDRLGEQLPVLVKASCGSDPQADTIMSLSERLAKLESGEKVSAPLTISTPPPAVRRSLASAALESARPASGTSRGLTAAELATRTINRQTGLSGRSLV